jgi:predicted HTH transcriptional regulator
MVASAEFDPIVVEPQLTEQKVAELVTRKRESAKLDYKQEWDPQRRRDVIELIKDLVAMANTAGGYVVIGLGDAGEEVGLQDAQVEILDEATLRAQTQSHLGVALELFLDKTISYGGKRYAIVTVLRSSRSPIVFAKDGQYPDPAGANRTVAAFRQGDVFVRHGSASERWNQDDVRTIYGRVVDREKERWLAEVVPDVRRLIEAAMGGRAPVVRTPEELLRGDAETFERELREILRRPE